MLAAGTLAGVRTTSAYCSNTLCNKVIAEHQTENSMLRCISLSLHCFATCVLATHIRT
jgi:hypothetical protein